MAAVAAATRMPFEWVEAALASQTGTGTTLDQTIVPPAGNAYAPLAVGPGEPWIPHPANPVTVRAKNNKRRVLVAFSQLSDIHLTDSESPLRVEWMDRFAEDPHCSTFPVGSAWRPQETLSTQTMAAMVLALNQVQLARTASKQAPLAFAVSTGDNTDNQQRNELDWFKRGIVGGAQQGSSGDLARYEGVQAPDWGDRAYWIPRDDVPDDYKTQHGWPGESTWGFGPDQFLTSAIGSFSTPALNHPCKVAFGNHDGLVQGTVADSELYRQVAVGGVKTALWPAAVADPCNHFGKLEQNLDQLFTGPAKVVTPDPSRRLVTRREYVQALVGHGFTQSNADSCTAYYTLDDRRFRFIVLDTTNPGGKEDGSIGARQFAWLEARISEAAGRYVILLSHHGLHTLTNPVPAADADPTSADPDCFAPPDDPRMRAPEVEAMLHQHPNVIAWVAGHTHQNRITLRRGANGHVLWDIETAAHVDWPCQSRILEVIDDGPALTIRCTMVDHAGPVAHADIAAANDPVLKLAAVHRELAANDPQVDTAEGAGLREDRNVELTLPKPAI